MAKVQRKGNDELAPNLPEKQTEWSSSTGRKVTPGTKFKVKGQSGKWIFVAYVAAATPYVEAVKERGGNIRCFDPEKIYNVSNVKGSQAK